MKREALIRFGKKVRDKREELGLSQEELAVKAGVHRTYIGMIERAEKNITLTNIHKIATALFLCTLRILSRPCQNLIKNLSR
jgi:transcriptional regulator with XRE-family HTH domain